MSDGITAMFDRMQEDQQTPSNVQLTEIKSLIDQYMKESWKAQKTLFKLQDLIEKLV